MSADKIDRTVFSLQIQNEPTFQALLDTMNRSPDLVEMMGHLQEGAIAFTPANKSGTFATGSTTYGTPGMSLAPSVYSAYSSTSEGLALLADVIGHELGHITKPGGFTDAMSSASNPQIATKIGLHAEAVALAAEYKVSLQLGTPMYSGSDVQNRIEGILLQDTNSGNFTNFDDEIFAAATNWVETAKSSAAPNLTYSEYYSQSYALREAGVDIANVNWSVIKPDDVIVANFDDGSWSISGNIGFLPGTSGQASSQLVNFAKNSPGSDVVSIGDMTQLDEYGNIIYHEVLTTMADGSIVTYPIASDPMFSSNSVSVSPEPTYADPFYTAPFYFYYSPFASYTDPYYSYSPSYTDPYYSYSPSYTDPYYSYSPSYTDPYYSYSPSYTDPYYSYSPSYTDPYYSYSPSYTDPFSSIYSPGPSYSDPFYSGGGSYGYDFGSVFGSSFNEWGQEGSALGDQVALSLDAGNVQAQSLPRIGREGILVYDPANAGASAGDEQQRRLSDLPALATMDTNGDGTLEALDATWAHLKLWIDGSSAGAASGGSLATIDSLGIASIGLASLQVNLTDGSQLSSDGTFAWQTAGAGDIMAAGSALDVAALANDIHKPTANYA